MNIITGVHSIVHALKNPLRSNHHIYATDVGLKNLKGYPSFRLSDDLPQTILSNDKFNQKAEALFKKSGYKFNRITSQVLLTTPALNISELPEIFKQIESRKAVKIICLDQVTDINNAAAILRTASFFAVDFMVTSLKGSFNLTPSFYRVASGAVEYVKIVRCASLPRFISKLKNLEVDIIALTEHGTLTVNDIKDNVEQRCLVLGAEDRGLSHAVRRLVAQQVALKGPGEINSLNVSVSAGIAIEKFFRHSA